jgi:hypothetical protein
MSQRPGDLDSDIVEFIAMTLDSDKNSNALDPCWVADALGIECGELDRCLDRLEVDGRLHVVRHGLPPIVNGVVTAGYYRMHAVSVSLPRSARGTKDCDV